MSKPKKPPLYLPGQTICSDETMGSVTTAFWWHDEWNYLFNDMPIDTDREPPILSKPDAIRNGNRYISESKIRWALDYNEHSIEVVEQRWNNTSTKAI